MRACGISSLHRGLAPSLVVNLHHAYREIYALPTQSHPHSPWLESLCKLKISLHLTFFCLNISTLHLPPLMANPRTPASRAQRLRPMSIYISYTPEEVARLAKEARDRTIADVNLELFSCWIRQKWDNYEEAKKHIRELGLDLVTSSHYYQDTDY